MHMGKSSSSSSYKLPKIMIMMSSNNNNNNNNNKSGQCKKHPKHRQSPGVCSLCLSEKLTRVPTTSTSRSVRSSANNNYYCSSSSSLSSSEDSSYASSPPPRPHHHRRIASDVLRANEVSLSSGLILKSRSMAFGGASHGVLREEEKRRENDDKKVISGFWSKLLRPRKNKKLSVDRKVLMISQSQPLGASSNSRMVVY